MIGWLFIALVVGVLGLIAKNWLSSAKPETRGALIHYGAALALGALGLLAAGRGLGPLGLVLLGAAGVIVFRERARPKRRAVRILETPHLRMRLEPSTGTLTGEVLAGAYRGRMLAAMSDVELAALRAEVAADAESVRLIDAYLDHRRSARGRAGDEGGHQGPMTRAEALDILGLSGAPTEAEIRHAHRTLIRKLHPDQGGTSYLAAKLNAARDWLLSHKF